jgi:CTP synthase
VRVGVVGKYIELQDAYKSVYEALKHGGIANDCGVQIEQIESEELEKGDASKILKELGGILIPGGFGSRGIEGKIKAAQFARENKIPYLGLCLGMQIATIEFARNVLGLEKAHSTEFDEHTPHPVIHLQETQRHVKRKGGSMRLGAQECQLAMGTLAQKLYGAFTISERHRHRYEINPEYIEQLTSKGLVFSGKSPDGVLMEIAELPKSVHPFFVGTQFHPEFKSKPDAAHPLFKAFIAAALNARDKR